MTFIFIMYRFRFFIIVLLFALISFSCYSQYIVAITFYLESIDDYIVKYDTINANNDIEANNCAFRIFLHNIADYDSDYLNILYRSYSEKSNILMPYDFGILKDNTFIKINKRYSIDRLLKRTRDDYWSKTYYRLFYYDESNNDDLGNESNIKSTKKRKRSKRTIQRFPKF